jgi:hypothetical protein
MNILKKLKNCMKPEELLNKVKETPAVAYHTFVMLQKDNKSDLFCFFEGNDSGYYYPRLKEYFKGKHHPIKCGNKKGVLETYELVKRNYSNIKTSFFIDNDFDDRININEIYETPCYSIENFYTSIEFVSDVLKNEFHLSEVDESYKNSLQLFEASQNDYHSKSLLFNAWYASMKEKANKNSCSTGVSLNCAIPSEFVLLKIGSISCEYDLEAIQNKYPDSLAVTQIEVEEKIEWFKSKNMNKAFRGKYELEFIYAFFQFLIDDANDIKKRQILKKRVRFRIDKALMLSQLSQYAETPECLVKYISNFN